MPRLEEEDDSNVYFSPEFGNVVFTSARDGWGFRYVSMVTIMDIIIIIVNIIVIIVVLKILQECILPN